MNKEEIKSIHSGEESHEERQNEGHEESQSSTNKDLKAMIEVSKISISTDLDILTNQLKPIMIKKQDEKGIERSLVVLPTHKDYSALATAYIELDELKTRDAYTFLKEALPTEKIETYNLLKDKITLEKIDDPSYMETILSEEMYNDYKFTKSSLGQDMKPKYNQEELKNHVILKSTLTPEQHDEYVASLMEKTKQYQDKLNDLAKSVIEKNTIKYKKSIKSPNKLDEQHPFKLQYVDKNNESHSVIVTPKNKAYKRLNQAHDYLNKLKQDKEKSTMRNQAIPDSKKIETNEATNNVILEKMEDNKTINDVSSEKIENNETTNDISSEKIKNIETYVNDLNKRIIEKDTYKNKKRNKKLNQEQILESNTISVSYGDEKYLSNNKNYKNLKKSCQKFIEQNKNIEFFTLNFKDKNEISRSVNIHKSLNYKKIAKICKRFSKQKQTNYTEPLILQAKNKDGSHQSVVVRPEDKKYQELVDNYKIAVEKSLSLSELKTKSQEEKLGRVANLIAKAKIKVIKSQMNSAQERINNHAQSILKKQEMELAK